MNSHSIATAELLKEEGSKFEMKIFGDCMEHMLFSGDVVQVIASKRYLSGDIIVFRELQGRLVAHRLLGTTLSLSGWRYMTKPDQHDRIDGLQEPGRVLGKLTVNISRRSEIRVSLVSRMGWFLRLVQQSLILAARRFSR